MRINEDRLRLGRDAALPSGITSITSDIVHHKEGSWLTLCWEQRISLCLSLGLLSSQFLIGLFLLFRRSKSSKVNRRVIL